MAPIVGFIDEALIKAEDDSALNAIRKQVNLFMKDFPLYPELG